jgi:hypothetical protein
MDRRLSITFLGKYPVRGYIDRMTNNDGMSNVVPMPDRSSARGRVATEVRSELAKAKITINRLPKLLGNSQSYWSRRISTADQALDVDDLDRLARLLQIPIWRFMTSRPNGTTPPPDSTGVLPRLDSNQQPFDYLANGSVVDLREWRTKRTSIEVAS